MKLISCQIAGFGFLCDRDFTFESGLTEFHLPNGSGKSTLAVFLRAMFYGLPTSKSNSTFNDREHFLPFSGAKFGGNLTFENDGFTYRIERFFDKKSQAKDSLLVRKNGTPTDELGECPGLTLFGLDEESFVRTLFFTADNVDTGSTPTLRAKLGNLTDGSDSAVTPEEAVDKINKAKNLLSAKGKGEISRLTEQIIRLNGEIADGKRNRENLQILYREDNEIHTRLAQLQPEIDAALTKRLRSEQWNRADDLQAALDGLKEHAERLSETYPNGFPTESELSDLRRDFTVAAQSPSAGFYGALRLSDLENRFKNGVPSEEDFERMNSNLSQQSVLSEKIRQTEAETSPAASLRFSSDAPSADTVRNLTAKFAAFKEHSAAVRDAENNRPKKKSAFSLPMFLTAAVLLAVAAVLVSVSLPVAIAVGVSALVLGVLSFFIGNSHDDSRLFEKQKENLAMEESELSSFLLSFGYDSKLGVDFAASAFLRDAASDDEKKKAEQERLLALASLKAQKETLQRECEIFFLRHGESSADFQALHRMEADRSELLRLRSEKEAFSLREKQGNESVQQAKNRISALLNAYRLTAGSDPLAWCGAVEADRKEADRLKTEITEQKIALNAFMQKNGLTDRDSENAANPDVLMEEQNACNEKRARLEAQIKESENNLEFLGEKEARLDNCREQLNLAKENADLLAAAADFILAAQTSVNERIVAPMKTAFTNYAAAIETLFGEKTVMTPDFQILFESAGEQHSEKHWSAGQRAVCSFCLRLALTDALFGRSPVPLFLDDPFAVLDSEHFAKLANLIRALTAERQMIYFTCHESRSIASATSEP